MIAYYHIKLSIMLIDYNDRKSKDIIKVTNSTFL